MTDTPTPPAATGSEAQEREAKSDAQLVKDVRRRQLRRHEWAVARATRAVERAGFSLDQALMDKKKADEELLHAQNELDAVIRSQRS